MKKFSDFDKLSAALILDEVDTFNELIKDGASVDAKSGFGVPIIFFAIRSNAEDYVARLVDNGADLKILDENGRTVLQCATMTHDFHLFDYLVDSGADINHKDYGEKTRLMWCIVYGETDLCEHLLSLKADPNICDKSGVSPLIKAVRLDRSCIVSLLVDAGADLFYKTYTTNMTAYDYAKKRGNTNLANYLESKMKEKK